MQSIDGQEITPDSLPIAAGGEAFRAWLGTLFHFVQLFAVGEVEDPQHSVLTASEQGFAVIGHTQGIQEITRRIERANRFAVASVVQAKLAIGTRGDDLRRLLDEGERRDLFGEPTDGSALLSRLDVPNFHILVGAGRGDRLAVVLPGE